MKKIKLVLPNKNENVIPNKSGLYPLLEPPNVSILNQVYATSDLMSNPLYKNDSGTNTTPTDTSTPRTAQTANKMKKASIVTNNDDNVKNENNESYDTNIKSSSETPSNVTKSNKEKLENKTINNVLYMIKMPKVGTISKNKLYHEIIPKELESRDPNALKNGKKNVILNSHQAELNSLSSERTKGNEGDAEFYLIPYTSLKQTIRQCQKINRGITKLRTPDYPKKAATIFQEYYLAKKPTSTASESYLNSKTSTDDPKLNLKKQNKRKTINKMHDLAIKYISASSPDILDRKEKEKEEEEKEKEEEIKKLSTSTKNHLNRAYYYNSVNDNRNQYENNNGYDIKVVELGNLKFHTAFQKSGTQHREPLMVNGCGYPKSRVKSANDINKKDPSYEEKWLKPYHSYSSFSSILSSYPSYSHNVIILIIKSIL